MYELWKVHKSPKTLFIYWTTSTYFDENPDKKDALIQFSKENKINPPLNLCAIIAIKKLIPDLVEQEKKETGNQSKHKRDSTEKV